MVKKSLDFLRIDFPEILDLTTALFFFILNVQQSQILLKVKINNKKLI